MAAGVAVGAVLLLTFVRGWWNGTGGTYVPPRTTYSATVSPESSLFGDVLTATVSVELDPRTIDPASVRVRASFAPYTVLSQSDRTERGVGRASIDVFSWSIECLVRDCISFTSTGPHTGTEAKDVAFPSALVTMRKRSGKPASERVGWTPFVVHSRLSASQIGLAQPTLDEHPRFPAVGWTIPPDLIAGAAIVLASLLGLVAVWLVASLSLTDGRVLFVTRIPRGLSRVERSLRLAEHAARRGEVDEERKALHRLAADLRGEGYGDLARHAGRLAWSDAERSLEEVQELARSIRSNGGRR